MLVIDYLSINKTRIISEQEFEFLKRRYKLEETEIGPRCCDCKRSWIDKWKTIVVIEK